MLGLRPRRVPRGEDRRRHAQDHGGHADQEREGVGFAGGGVRARVAFHGRAQVPRQGAAHVGVQRGRVPCRVRQPARRQLVLHLAHPRAVRLRLDMGGTHPRRTQGDHRPARAARRGHPAGEGQARDHPPRLGRYRERILRRAEPSLVFRPRVVRRRILRQPRHVASATRTQPLPQAAEVPQRRGGRRRRAQLRRPPPRARTSRPSIPASRSSPTGSTGRGFQTRPIRRCRSIADSATIRIRRTP